MPPSATPSGLPPGGEAELALGALRQAIDALGTAPPHSPLAPLQQTTLQEVASTLRALASRAESYLRQVRPPPSPKIRILTKESKPAKVEVVPGLSLPVMCLPEDCRDPRQVVAAIRGPALCWVPAWGHFAVRLGDMLLHGHIGEVTPRGERGPTPPGLTPCARAGCPGSGCPFYHDPAATPYFLQNRPLTAAPPVDSPLHVRSFRAESFAYDPPRPGRPMPPTGARRIGGAATFLADARAASPAEAQAFLDQVAHDLICAVALVQARGGPAPGGGLPS